MKSRAGILLFFVLILSTFSQKVIAQGNLLVAPIRVVFEGGKLKEDLNLTNIGQDTANYVISFLHYQMQKDGSFKQIENSDTLSTRAEKFLRIVPRKVVLPPGESQTIRLAYRKTAETKPGEYRSHLYFRAEKDVTALGMNTSKVDSGKMSVSITPIFGISIPVIIREGDLKYSMSISNVGYAVVNDTTSAVNFMLNRTGARSSYGNIRVEFVPANGKTYEVGLANGIGVYTDINSRMVSIPVKNRPDQRLKNGKLVIRYSLPREEGEAVLAKAEYQIP